MDICGSTICNLLLLRYFIVRSLRKKRLFFLSTDPRSLFPLLFLLHGIGDFVFAVLKIAYNVQPIVGRDVSVTLLATCLPIFCFIGLVLYYDVILSFLRGYSRMMRAQSRQKVNKLFAKLKAFATWIPLIGLLPCIMPLIGLKYPEYTNIFGMLYLLGNGFLALLYGLLFNLALGFLLLELDVHLKHLESTGGDSNDIRFVSNRLHLAYRTGTIGFIIIGFSYIIFGSWQVLLQMSSYLFLCVQIVVHPTFTVLILTVSRISQGQSRLGPSKVAGIHADDGVIRSSVDSNIDSISRSGSKSMIDDHELIFNNAEMKLKLHMISSKA